jgi:signal peptidase I
MFLPGGSLAMADEPRRTASPGRGSPGAFASNKSGWATEFPPIESVVIDGRRRIVYAGPSMNPTLREPDLLWVEPYGNGPVRVGDVVCFKSPEKDANIVHRVISVVHPEVGTPHSSLLTPHSALICTRGDNNPQPDPWAIGVDSLLGRVVAAQRGSRRRPIPGGRTGRIVAWSVRLRKAIWRVAAGIVSGAYQCLVRCGPFDFLLPGGLRPRLVSFNGRAAATLKLLMGRRVVGRYDRESKEWQIRRPFRLFVDARALPDAVSSSLVLRSSSSAVDPEASASNSPSR